MASDGDGSPPEARLLHHTPTRTRYRVPARQGDPAYFESVHAALTQAPRVRQVTCNPLTGSVLVQHEPDLNPDDLEALARRAGCFAPVDPPPARTPIQEVRRLYRRIENDTVRATQGRLDLESASLLLLAVSAISGVLRGHIAFPAATAVWYALQLIRLPSPSEAGDLESPDRRAGERGMDDPQES
jgi:hypothetical protein